MSKEARELNRLLDQLCEQLSIAMAELAQSTQREATLLKELAVVRTKKETLSAFIAEKDRSVGEILELLPLTQPSPEPVLTSGAEEDELIVESAADTRTDDIELEDWELFITQVGSNELE